MLRCLINKKWVAAFLSVTLIFGITLWVSFASNSSGDKNGKEAQDPFGNKKLGSVNFLVTGVDRAAGLSDAIMLVNFDRDEKSVFIMQIPRDTYLRYTEKNYKKINGAPLSLGGADALRSFLADVFSIDIDHYISFDLDALSDAVDAIGGIEITLPCDMKYKGDNGEEILRLKSGKNLIDGKGAELIVRYRSGYADGDIGRLDAQKLFMAAGFEKVKNDISPELVLSILKNLKGFETDLGLFEVAELLREAKEVRGDKLSFCTMPGEAATATSSGASYYVVSLPACEEIIQKYFGGSDDIDKKALMLNGDYKSFAEIYRGYSNYDIFISDDINRDGVSVENTK